MNYKYEENRKFSLNSAEGIVRFEVQLYYQKLYNTTRSSKWKFDSLDINNFISDYFTEQMLLYYLRKISFEGDFFTLERAKQVVWESNIFCHKKTKDNLINLLSQVSRQRGWRLASENIYNELPPNAVNYMLGLLDRMGVNVVTIPQNWSSEYFQSPIHLVQSKIDANIALYPSDNAPILFSDGFTENRIDSIWFYGNIFSY